MNNSRVRALHRNMEIKLLYVRFEEYQNHRLDNSNYIFLATPSFCKFIFEYINAKYKVKYKIYDIKPTNQFSNIAQWLCAKEYINGNIGL